MLGLRILLPLSDDAHPRSTHSKLCKYPKLFSAEATWTVLDELIPVDPAAGRALAGQVAVEMTLAKQRGLFNWVAGCRPGAHSWQ